MGSRRLDGLVAERVIGYRLCPEIAEDNGWDMGMTYPEGDLQSFEQVPLYSTDIGAAWKLFDQFVGGSVRKLGKSGRWFAEFWVPVPPYFLRAEAETAPLAICLAALAGTQQIEGTGEPVENETPHLEG